MKTDSAAFRLARQGLIGLAIAVALALASVGLHRIGPELADYGTGCGPTGEEPCARPLVNGGWPLGFVYDRPGVAVEDRLGLEDQFRPGAFLADVVFYGGLLTLAWRMGQARRRRAAMLRAGRKT